MEYLFERAKEIWKSIRGFGNGMRDKKRKRRLLTSVRYDLQQMLKKTSTEPSLDDELGDEGPIFQNAMSAYSLSVQLLKRNADPDFTRIAVSLLVAATKNKEVAKLFLDSDCLVDRLVRLFGIKHCVSEVVDIIMNLLEADETSLKSRALVHIQQSFVEAERTLDPAFNVCQNFLERMEPLVLRSPLTFLEVVASHCYLEESFEFDFFDGPERIQEDPCYRIFLKEKEASIEDPPSPTFCKVLDTLVDTLLLVFRDPNQLVRVTTILDLLTSAALVYPRAPEVLVASLTRCQIFKNLMTCLVQKSANQDLNQKVGRFLLVVATRCKQGEFEIVMECYSQVLSEFVEYSAEKRDINKLSCLLYFMMDALKGQDNLRLPDSLLSLMGQNLLKLLQRYCTLVVPKEQDTFKVFELILESLNRISNVWYGYAIAPSTRHADAELFNDNLFSFKKPETKPQWMELFYEELSSQFYKKLRVQHLDQNLVPTTTTHEDATAPQHEDGTLLSSDDCKEILRTFLQVAISQSLVNDTIPSGANILPLLVKQNRVPFLDGLLDLLHSKTDDATSEPHDIYLLLSIWDIVLENVWFEDAGWHREDISFLFRLLERKSHKQTFVVLSLLSLATLSKISLDALRDAAADIEPLYKLLSDEKYLPEDENHLASLVLSNIIKSHKQHQEAFNSRFQVLVRDLIGNCEKIENLLLRLASLLTVIVDNMSLSGTSLDFLWGHLNKSVEETLSRRETQASVRHMACIFSFCMKTKICHRDFAKRHQDILNEFIREDTHLLDESFNVLLKMPDLLDFPNRLSYFRRCMDHQRQCSDSHTLCFAVSREHVFEDTFNVFEKNSARRFRTHFRVNFEGEAGVDLGGPKREWFSLLSREIIIKRDNKHALFCDWGDSSRYQPNRESDAGPTYYKFIGNLAGLAIATGHVIEFLLTPSMYKHIMGIEVTYKDMLLMDPILYNSWLMLLNEMDAADVENLGVCLQDSDIPLTIENRVEYVEREAQILMTTSIDEKIKNFCEGLCEMIPEDLLSIFTYVDLPLVMSGIPSINVDEHLRPKAVFRGLLSNDLVRKCFWEALLAMNQEELADVLGFWTGSRVLPAEGFELTINITDNPGGIRLPKSNTCVKTLHLPVYTSTELLKSKLLKAANLCSSFEFA